MVRNSSKYTLQNCHSVHRVLGLLASWTRGVKFGWTVNEISGNSHYGSKLHTNEHQIKNKNQISVDFGEHIRGTLNICAKQWMRENQWMLTEDLSLEVHRRGSRSETNFAWGRERGCELSIQPERMRGSFLECAVGSSD